MQLEHVLLLAILALVGVSAWVGYSCWYEQMAAVRGKADLRRLGFEARLQQAQSLVEAGLEPSLLEIPPGHLFDTHMLTCAKSIFHGTFAGHPVITCCRSEGELTFLGRASSPLPSLRLCPRSLGNRPIGVPRTPMGADFDHNYGLEGDFDPGTFASDFAVLVAWLASHSGWEIRFLGPSCWVMASRATVPPATLMPRYLQEFTHMIEHLPGAPCESGTAPPPSTTGTTAGPTS